MDEKIIEEGFWVSDEKFKRGIGVKIELTHTEDRRLEEIEIQTIDRTKDDMIDDVVTIFRDEFERLIQFVDLLKEEMKENK